MLHGSEAINSLIILIEISFKAKTDLNNKTRIVFKHQWITIKNYHKSKKCYKQFSRKKTIFRFLQSFLIVVHVLRFSCLFPLQDCIHMWFAIAFTLIFWTFSHMIILQFYLKFVTVAFCAVLHSFCHVETFLCIIKYRNNYIDIFCFVTLDIFWFVFTNVSHIKN